MLESSLQHTNAMLGLYTDLGQLGVEKFRLQRELLICTLLERRDHDWQRTVSRVTQEVLRAGKIIVVVQIHLAVSPDAIVVRGPRPAYNNVAYAALVVTNDLV
jgi:hypothetical protein